VLYVQSILWTPDKIWQTQLWQLLFATTAWRATLRQKVKNGLIYIHNTKIKIILPISVSDFERLLSDSDSFSCSLDLNSAFVLNIVVLWMLQFGSARRRSRAHVVRMVVAMTMTSHGSVFCKSLCTIVYFCYCCKGCCIRGATDSEGLKAISK